jgi:hypothetical protein
MRVIDLLNELSGLDRNREIYFLPSGEDNFIEANTLSDILYYEEKELAEDEDGYLHDFEEDELDKHSIRRKVKAVVFYPTEM